MAWPALCAVLCCLPALVTAQARSQASAPEDPSTLVLSNTLRYDDTKRTSVFTGNVVMTRGDMTLHADRLDLREDAEGFQHAVATVAAGKQVRIRQERPESFEVIDAQGARGEYNGKTEHIDLIGKAVITRFICGEPFDTISGQRVRYNQKADTYEAYSDPKGQGGEARVRSLAMPRARINAAVAQCRQQAQQSNRPAALRPAARTGAGS